VAVAAEAAARRVRELLQRVADAMALEVEIEVAEGEEGIVGTFGGEDVGALIGHRGQTLDAIQHLAYRIAFRGEGERGRVTVDAGGYRERRAAALRASADRAAEDAVRERRPVALEPMSALERRVIHEHLKARHDVETYSEGEEPARRLVVAPVVE
jgi:spoIIIJ-associated protein